MSYINFEWDPDKAEKNLLKHGVTFEEAQTAFYDVHARLIPDPDSSFGEERFLLLGQSTDYKTLMVCHCYRDPDEQVRIISARKADKNERKQYEVFRYA